MKQQKAKQDILLMLFFVIASLVLLFYIFPNYITVTKMMEKEVFTPKTFPTVIGYAILLCSGIGLVNSVLAYRSAVKEEGKQEKTKKSKEELIEQYFPYLIYVLIVVYVLLYTWLGIVPASLIMPPVMLWCLKCRNWKAYVAYYVFFLVMYLLFKQVLLVPIK